MQKGFADCLKPPTSDAAGNQTREILQGVGQFIRVSKIRIPSIKFPTNPLDSRFSPPHFAIWKSTPGKRVRYPSDTALCFRPASLQLAEPQPPALRSGTTVTASHSLWTCCLQRFFPHPQREKKLDHQK